MIGSAGSVAATLIISTTAAVAPGSSIIVVASATGAASTAVACRDPVNGTYTVDEATGNPGGGAVLAICATHNTSATTASGTAITITWPGTTATSQLQGVALAATGLGSSPLDQKADTGATIQNGSALTVGPTSATTAANELLIGAFYVSTSMANAGFTAGTNGTANVCASSGTPTYTTLAGAGANQFSVWVEQCVVSAAGAYSARGTAPGAAAYVPALVTYRQSAPTAAPIWRPEQRLQ